MAADASLAVDPLDGPIDAEIRVPGSKSYTNRALLVAALATGESHLHGVLRADDTEAMFDAVTSMGVGLVGRAPGSDWVEVLGLSGRIGVDAHIDARLSGTTARFVLAALAASTGTAVLDGSEALRRRPMDDGIRGLRDLGMVVEGERLPLRVSGGPAQGGEIQVRGDVSSQFLSGMLMVAPCLPDGLEIEVVGTLVSASYVHMTVAVMRDFGAEVEERADRITVRPGGYRSRRYTIEPDASAASYFFAAAAIVGGRVRVAGLGSASMQGDLRLVGILGRMGATVRQGPDWTEVERDPATPLRGVDVDMSDCSDVAQTLAMVAVFADGPTTIEGIGFIRRKETDRIGAVVAELARCGVVAEELADGLRVHPGSPRPATVETYEDHRMAMSFSLLGLRVPGIRIADPGCVAKTFPDFFDVLDSLRPGLR